jgi:hypothetical protein
MKSIQINVSKYLISVNGIYEKCIQSFVSKTCREGPLGRSKHRWEDNIEINLK